MSSLLAGAIKTDITPKEGTQISGDIGRHRPVEEVLDPLYAKALVLADDETKLCVISLDLAHTQTEFTTELRSKIAEILGSSPEHVMVHSTHNHAGPALGRGVPAEKRIPKGMSWLVCSWEEEYTSFAEERILDAVRRASERLEPAELGLARGVDGRVAFNRRFIMRDGRAKTHPAPCDPNILYNEGPIDPEVAVAAVRIASGEIAALMLHHTCHPVHFYPLRKVSAGWPGAWAAEMENAVGQECTALVLNGCCGNVHYNDHLDPGPANDHTTVGKLLKETAEEVMKRLDYTSGVPLAAVTRTLSIPWRKIPEKALKEARELLDKHPQPTWKEGLEGVAAQWDWVHAVRLLDRVEKEKEVRECTYEVQVFRIGALAIAAFPGEPFVQMQLEMKLKSPADFTFGCEQGNGRGVGYVPTAEAVEKGGYEAEWSRLDPGALETIGKNAVEMLNDLFE